MKKLIQYKVDMVYEDKTYTLKGDDAKRWIEMLGKIVKIFQLESSLPGFKWEENDNHTDKTNRKSSRN
jgi:hypothetical protein